MQEIVSMSDFINRATIRKSASTKPSVAHNPKLAILHAIEEQRSVKQTWLNKAKQQVNPRPGGVSFIVDSNNQPTVWEEVAQYDLWCDAFEEAINSGELDVYIEDWAERVKRKNERKLKTKSKNKK